MPFDPRPEYVTIPKEIEIKDFFEYKDSYVTRPPYQRKSVWSRKKKQALMDSLFRRYYIPKLVIREVRLSERHTIHEIIDGQQRIMTVQEFFANEYPLPKTLKDLGAELPGAYYNDLPVDIRKYIDRSLTYYADIIKNIDKPNSVEHQMIATEIFWRLQQGESLNYMEVAHAQLSSLSRNFIVKYADDQTFDYEAYKPVDENKHKLPFFKLLNVDNVRMKHLQFMARFLLIEIGGGYANLSDKSIEEFINEHKQTEGIGDYSFENTREARSVIRALKRFYDIFKDDPMLDDENGLKELSTEYFIISIYMLIRHLDRYYVFDDRMKETFRQYFYWFFHRWKNYDESVDTDMLSFSNRRQQGESDLIVRDIIARKLFFEYCRENSIEVLEKDSQRAFSELQRISIYRRDKGMCQQCLREGLPEGEALVSWSEYQADHVIPHSKGGRTSINNAELLCRHHNQIKGAALL